MPDQNEEQRAQARRQQERQYEIDRITAQYADDYRLGLAPRIEAYLQRYPEYASELLEFAVYFHTIGFDLEAPDVSPAAELSPAAQRAMQQIRAATGAPAVQPIEGLVKQGTKVGYSPRNLAEAVGLTIDVLAKLEARVIAVATIPPTLVTRLATTLQVVPEAVATYLGATRPGQAGAFYYADQQPTQQQESFLDAVQASMLSPERKQEWATIVENDTQRGE